MVRKMTSVLAMVSIIALLSGCWDRREINDVAFVMATAYDKDEEGYRVSFQFPLVGQLGSPGGGGGGTSGGKSWYMDSATGSTIREADDHQQQSLPRELYFGHRRVLIFGEELARDNIATVTDISARLPENRLTALAVVAKGQGRDILNAESTVERIPSEMIRELVIQTMGRPITIKMMIDNLKSDGVDLMLPAIKLAKTEPGSAGKAESSIKLVNFAVFRGDRLSGFLDEELTQGLLISSGYVRGPYITVNPPEGKEGRMTVRLVEIEQQITPLSTTPPYTYELSIRARGGVAENQSDFNLSHASHLVQVERVLNDRITTMVEKALEELKRLKSDPLGFGDALYRKHPDIWHEIRHDWHEDFYSNIQVKVNSDIHIEYPGSLIFPTRKGVSQ
ncbi:Ger(x)C family spore germination protein [Xylanibacillus composti]|uniref:Putative spore germination protein YfkR n=1 Tax=Xylanibacillus composti TaxID=1572762 RepID=A0A8J4H7G6_9BACL|nr:Ger(x)C family spore germination protein [Xylanibacillus composti]MDT9725730.1 Ger(x)C family spore germination protein [Xylanibacillus composti]GIQ71131.1 putative spore germination protein YfkR [Xylanibacillus composti]